VSRRLALDAMGGDDAPRVPAAAAALAVRKYGLDVVLVGDPAAVAATGVRDVPVVPADQVVGMGEEGALAVRAKPRASIRVAVGLVAEHAAAAVVSAGSTGATLAAALLGLGRLPGVRRPAIAAVLPAPGGGTVLVDAGASMDVQPEALLAHARMGLAYARVRGVAQPRLGLLNVGTEPGKGTELARAAAALLAEVPGFAGNVEPRHVLTGKIDVVVTDGFTGNVMLKTLEAASVARSYGGPGAAVLLGIAGPVLVAHGAAGINELVMALRTADQVVSEKLVDRITAVLPGP
jgi:glycerol-3-phosphate acyltransferase PlsX